MFERMLVGRMENRITVGVLAFVATMILLGWAAINEGGRMTDFTISEHARSIENGAAIFSSTCTTCHGEDGRGLTVRAPGLNNPQFFGHDFFPEVTKQIADLTAEKTSLTAEQTDLTAQLAATPAPADDQKTQINTRLGEIVARMAEIDTTVGDLTTQRNDQVQAAIDNGYDPARFSRLQNLGWAGTHQNFILTTVLAGRPVSAAYWPQAMPTWSQLGSGPLRMDQIEDLVAYVENWDKGDQWTLDDLFAVNQFAIEPGQAGPGGGGTIANPVGTDVTAVLAQLANVTGDAARGEELYHGKTKTAGGEGAKLPCSGCHQQSSDGTGPMADGLFTRVTDIRLKEPQFAGYTPEQYIVESILLPGNYVVPNFNNVMLATFGEKLEIQDLADLLAYLETLK